MLQQSTFSVSTISIIVYTLLVSGLHCEGIYRISGVKSKVQHLKDQYNRGEPAFLEEHEPNIVAGVLKQFLRELPEPVLTNSLIPKFEEASSKLRFSSVFVFQHLKIGGHIVLPVSVCLCMSICLSKT